MTTNPNDDLVWRRLEKMQNDLRRLVVHYLKGRVPSNFRPSDMLQQAFVEALKEEGLHGKGTQELKGWIVQRAMSRAIDNVRKVLSEPRVVPLEEELTEAIPSPGSDDSMERDPSESVTRLRNEFHRLTPEQRQVLIGRRVHKLSIRELALQMGKSEKAVSMLLNRALQRLRLRVRPGELRRPSR